MGPGGRRPGGGRVLAARRRDGTRPGCRARGPARPQGPGDSPRGALGARPGPRPPGSPGAGGGARGHGGRLRLRPLGKAHHRRAQRSVDPRGGRGGRLPGEDRAVRPVPQPGLLKDLVQTRPASATSSSSGSAPSGSSCWRCRGRRARAALHGPCPPVRGLAAGRRGGCGPGPARGLPGAGDREAAREQARLARDVHDVVGHSLAVILAQASRCSTCRTTSRRPSSRRWRPSPPRPAPRCRTCARSCRPPPGRPRAPGASTS
jgi:hypothetical protein